MGVVLPVNARGDLQWTAADGDRVEHLEGPVPSLSDIARRVRTIRIREGVQALCVNTIPFTVLFLVNLWIVRAIYRQAEKRH
jgi:hypothetical protein